MKTVELIRGLTLNFQFTLPRSYWVQNGIVTGGQYNSSKGCQPYKIPACDHHVVGHLKPCGSILPTPPCKRQCISGKNAEIQ